MKTNSELFNPNYEAPVVEELGTLESVVKVTGAGTNADGELFNS